MCPKEPLPKTGRRISHIWTVAMRSLVRKLFENVIPLYKNLFEKYNIFEFISSLNDTQLIGSFMKSYLLLKFLY